MRSFLTPPSRSTLACLLVAWLALSARPAGAQDAALTSEIARRVEALESAASIEVGGREVPRSDVLIGLYRRRSFAPVWSDPARVEQLIAVVRELRLDGLIPDDYHLGLLEAVERPASAARAAELELLRTDALIRAAHDLRFGKLEPSGPGSTPDLSRPLNGADAVAALEAILSAPRLDEAVRALRSDHFVYLGLVRALAELRRIEEAGGWALVPAGPALALDSVDARVPLLRNRLVLEGDLSAEADRRPDPRQLPRATDPAFVFDAPLEQAVRAFQHRHGLNEDGVVGRATLRELNVPVARRIQQVRVNLERARWVTPGLPQTFVVVNIAGAKVYLLREGAVVFESRTVVGASYTRTPVFRAEMQYIELNPTWTVPPSIVGELLGAARGEIDYFTSRGFRFLNRAGDEVDPATIDLAGVRAAAFPWTVRQDAGPLNPLGRIKLMFPNAYNVYLHDTPRRDLFGREERLFSHGCIRVQDPFELAALILDEPERWSRTALEQAAEAGSEPFTIPLTRPLPVLLLYWTASADAQGTLHFYRDVYRRDAELLAALDAR